MNTEQILRTQWKQASLATLQQHQLARLNALLAHALRDNSFYRKHLGSFSYPLQSLDQLATLPLLTKDVISNLDERGLPPHHTWPLASYSRFHRTSGTRGRPLPILDTHEDWRWWIETWQYVLDAAEISTGDRALMAFSFGPFIGFWSGYDALVDRGALLIPAGGMSSLARLQLARDSQATVLCCTPTYALHLAQVAIKQGFCLEDLAIRKIVVAGEPGGSIPAVRQRIESLWNGKLTDHAGATEIGPWGFGSRCGTGIHVIETEFIAEIVDPHSLQGVAEGERGELVITNLGRFGSPVIRYRTGDQVRSRRRDDLGCSFLWLDGGVLGRTDDMAVVRGVNIFPSSIEAIVREFQEIGEFQILLERRNEMDELSIRFEATSETCLKPLADRLATRLGLRIPVEQVATGTLAISEGKSLRLIDLRSSQLTPSK